MPFTPAHAATAFPLARLLPSLPLLALLVGTQAPDLPLLFPQLVPSYELTHAWTWLIPANLPAAVVLLLACEWMKSAGIALLPRPARRRLSAHAAPRWPTDGKAWLLTCLALIVGAASHLFWDEFTHEGRLGVELFPVLGEPWIGSLPGCRLLQYACGLLGTPIVALLCYRWYLEQPEGLDLAQRWREPVRKGLLLLLIVATPLACALWAYWVTSQYDWPLYAFVHTFAFHSVTYILAAELLVCLALRALFVVSATTEGTESTVRRPSVRAQRRGQ